MFKIESTQVIDRPVDKVFHFFAVNHVRNHPRWDNDIELWLDKDEPIKVGTIINRPNKRSGKAVEGTMEVMEFEPNRLMTTHIREGEVETNGMVFFEPIGDNQTRITIRIEIPGMDASADSTFLAKRLEEAAMIRKNLMESEIE